MTFSRTKWSWLPHIGHNRNLYGMEGFFLDGYEEWRIYDRVHYCFSRVQSDLDDMQQGSGKIADDDVFQYVTVDVQIVNFHGTW